MAILLLSSSLLTLPARAAEVVRAAPWEFHNSFWMSLHQTLLNDVALAKPRELSGFSAEEQRAWNDSVAAYRAAVGHDDISFARPVVITTDALTQVADDATEPVIDAPLAGALERAAPVYRAHGWTADERANRFFIGYAAAMIRDAGSELVRQHEKAYRTKWPERVLVFVTPYAGPFGAYTVAGRAGGAITTMSCRDEGYQGLRALEMLLHESSHAVVGPVKGTVADAIEAAAKRHGVTPKRDLAHAIIFATSSELTRRALAERGVTAFVPSSVDLFTRVWPNYREAIQTYWIPYVDDGRGTLEEAIDAIVAATSAGSPR